MTRSFDILSNDNTLYATGRCNNRCRFCCQPPVAEEDAAALWKENMRLIECAPSGIGVVGISGGEPTLLGERLFELIEAVVRHMPEATIHLLSNGRAFRDAALAGKVVAAAHGRLVAGVPLHSDYCGDHDFIAGSTGAFDHTVAGICNLAAAGAAVELRVVINRHNYRRLPDISRYIHRNLPFVSLTAFMAMERIGLAESDAAEIWAEPCDYSAELAAAVEYLHIWRHPVAIYNVPLCLLPAGVRRFACRSISDWKQCYIPACHGCSLRSECCGLFATSSQPFRNIRAI